MANKKITRKVISKPVAQKQPSHAESKTEETAAEETKQIRTKRACFFCQSKTSPSYTDIAVLRRFTTDRAKIVPRAKSNLCSKHQREITKQIKYARFLALLPFVPKV